MSNNSRKSVLVICLQGQYGYLPSNIHIFPQIQLPVSVSGVKHYMSEYKERWYIKICMQKLYFNQINTFQNIGIIYYEVQLKRNNWLKCIRRVE
jgi:hypothetical protein